jgi:prepilin-type N-terminal cleavage/methylation domain-containing protein
MTQRARQLPVPAHQRGTSLVEVMIALVVLSIGILAVSQLFTAGSRGEEKGSRMTAASLYAQQTMDGLRSLDWSATDLAPGAHGPDSVGSSRNYVVTYVVSTMPPPMDQAKRVDVTVSYKLLGDRSVSATTYITK